MDFVIAAGLGLVGGFALGFAGAIAGLALKRARNYFLAARGESLPRDLGIPPEVPLLCALVGLVVAPVLAVWLSRWPAVGIGAGALPAIYVLLHVAAVVAAMRRPSS